MHFDEEFNDEYNKTSSCCSGIQAPNTIEKTHYLSLPSTSQQSTTPPIVREIHSDNEFSEDDDDSIKDPTFSSGSSCSSCSSTSSSTSSNEE